MDAKREKVTEMAGSGCMIQTLGLAAPVFGLFVLGDVGLVGGLVVMVVLFLVGSAKSQWWRCGNCRNRLSDRQVRICPVCHAQLR